MRIIFNKNKFVHTREIFKEQKILNIYQSNILNSIIFMHGVENKTAPSIFLTKFCKPSHSHPTNFSAHNFLVTTLKLKKVRIEFLLEARYVGATFSEQQKKTKKVFQNSGQL